MPHLLLADGSYEFLEVERSEVGYVLEVARVVGCESWLDHRGCLRSALAEGRVRVLDDIGAFASAVAYEQAWSLLQILCKAVFVDDCRSGLGNLSTVSEAEALGGRYSNAQAGV